MKHTHIRLLVILLILITSCSKKEDNTNAQLTPSYQTMAGNWYYTSYTKSDGVNYPYVGKCGTSKDYANIVTNGVIKTYVFYVNCSSYADTCSDYYFSGNRVINCTEVFDQARVTSLTSTTMKLEYDTPRSFGTIVGGGATVLFLSK